MSTFSRLRCARLEAQEWNRRVAREAERQARIEAAFDRADALDRLGDAERALESLDQAGALSGGLAPTYRTTRLRLCREVARLREAGAPLRRSGTWPSRERRARRAGRRAR